MVDVIAAPLPRVNLAAARIALIPLGFLLLGLLVRYLGYVAVWDEPSLATFAKDLCRWDCVWYVGMAERGYDPFPVPAMTNAGNWAFFPLYPMLIGALRLVSGLPTMTIATVVSLALAYAAVVIAWPLFEGRVRAYALYAAFVLAGPFSVYFTTFYTEVMFVLLMTAVFLALRQSNYLLAGLFAALLSATRIVGVFIVFAILAQAFLDHRRTGGTLMSFPAAALKRPDLVLGIFIAPLGLFCYMLFLHLQIGDALAFSHVQRAWGRSAGSPLTYIWNGLTRFSDNGFLPSVPQQLALASIYGLAMTARIAFKRQFPAAAFCLACIVIPLCAGLASMLRFVVALVPLTVELCQIVARTRIGFYLGLAVLLAGCYFATIGWLTGYLSLV